MIIYKQLESTDCGATCLRMICKFYKKDIDIRYLRSITFTSKNGVSLNSIINAATKIGLESMAVKITFNDFINDNLFPALLHWKNNHYVVAYKKSNDKYIHIADPAFGKMRLNEKEFNELWNVDDENKGVAVFFETTPKFNQIYDKEKNKAFDLSFFYKYIHKYKNKLLVVFFLLIILSSFSYVFPYLNKELIDKGISKKNLDFVFILFLGQFILYSSMMIIEIIQDWIFLKVKINIGIDIINDFLIKLVNMPISFFENKLTTDILLRIDDHDKIENFFSNSSIQFFISSLSFVIFSYILYSYSSLIFSIFIIGTLFSIFWVLWFHKQRKVINYQKFELESLKNNLLYELINGIDDVKINNLQSIKIKEWEYLQNKLYVYNKKELKLENIQEIGVNYFSNIKNITILFLASYFVINNILTLGEMLSISFIIGQLNAPIQMFIFFVYSIQDAKISIERLQDVYDKKDELQLSNNYNDFTLDGIFINNLNFHYLDKIELPILKNINFNIPINKVTAIVGPSGSGKTTLVKLLLKFYTPSYGEILIGNNNINNINFAKWRDKISVVFQDGYIFSDSLKNNIIMSNNYDETKYNQIIKYSNVIEFENQLPQKSETKIGENGIGLSKGQKQRILIARAFYKNPDIIIFDEATSALDAENEKIIHDNLQQFFKGKTVLIIAHRLSTVKNADQIIVLKNGEIAEIGNHQQLVQNKADYFNLVKNQLELGN
jgi:ATP-binding cassette subfamily B protein